MSTFAARNSVILRIRYLLPTSYGQLRSDFSHLGRFLWVWYRVEPLFLAERLNLDRPHTSENNFQHVVFLRDDEYYSEIQNRK